MIVSGFCWRCMCGTVWCTVVQCGVVWLWVRDCCISHAEPSYIYVGVFYAH